MCRCKKTFTFLVACLASVSPTIATPLFTGFDAFSEGVIGSTFTDGGITFSALDQYSGSGPGAPFIIEGTDGVGLGPSFSPPNYLTTQGLVPGPGFSFGRFGSARITFGPVT